MTCLGAATYPVNHEAPSSKSQPEGGIDDDEVVEKFVADVEVEDAIIVELKSFRRVVISHELPLTGDLVATGKPVGLLLNTGEKKVDVKRKVKYLNWRQDPIVTVGLVLVAWVVRCGTVHC